MMMREIKSWEANLHSLQTSGVLHMKNGRGLWNLVITLDNHKRKYKTASVNSLILPLALKKKKNSRFSSNLCGITGVVWNP